MSEARQAGSDDPMDHLATTSQSSLLIVVLGWVAGCFDAVGFLALFEIFFTFQSGNSVLLGVSLGQGRWLEAIQFVAPIGAFLVGVSFATGAQRQLEIPTDDNYFSPSIRKARSAKLQAGKNPAL